MSHREQRIEDIRIRVGIELEKLEKEFAPGTVLTFIARQPGDADGRFDCMVTAERDEDADELIALVTRRMKGGAA